MEYCQKRTHSLLQNLAFRDKNIGDGRRGQFNTGGTGQNQKIGDKHCEIK